MSKSFRKPLAICLLLAVLLGASLLAFGEEAATEEAAAEGHGPLGLGATSAVLYCGNTGETLYSEKEDEQGSPYGFAGLLTTLLAVQKFPLTTQLTVSATATAQPGPRLGLLEGEVVTVEQLAYGSLLGNYNDCTYVLAEAVVQKMEEETGAAAGSMEPVTSLSQTLSNLDCRDTQLAAPTGYGGELANNHITTNNGMELIKVAFADGTIAEIASATRYTMVATNLSGERTLSRTVPLLEDPASGVKAVITAQPEGGTMMMAVLYEDHGLHLLGCLMGANPTSVEADMTSLLSYGTAHVEGISVVTAGEEVGKVRVKRGAKTTIVAYAAEDGLAYLPKEASRSLLRGEAVVREDVEAPVKAGDVIGVYEIYMQDELVNTIDLVAGEDVAVGWLPSYIGISNRVTIIMGCVLALVILFLLVRAINRGKARRRRKQIRKAKIMQMAQEELQREEEEARRGFRR